MFTLTKWIAAPALAIGLLCAADAPHAQAQYGCYNGGGLSLSFGGGYYAGYRPSYGGLYRSNFGYGGIGSFYGYHPRHGHYDYHPTELIRHGNHFHVQPGHFDYHHVGHGRHGHGGHH
jgi:hypothetical protein